MQPSTLIFAAFGLPALLLATQKLMHRLCIRHEMQTLSEAFRITFGQVKLLQCELRGLKHEFDIRASALPQDVRTIIWQPVDEITERATEALLDNDNVDAIKLLELAVREARSIVLKGL